MSGRGWIVAMLAACACSPGTGAQSDAGSTGVGEAGSAAVGTGSSDGGSTAAEGGSGSGTTGGPASGPADETAAPPVVFDLGRVPDFFVEEGCHAVDFLFVIDDSGSMYEHQQNLKNNFPTFIAGIQSTLSEVDSYQVGVVATDSYPYNQAPCTELGELVISTVGSIDGSEAVCGPFAEGYNFMTQEDDLAAEFDCAAQLGTYGDGIERPMEAMVNTVSKIYNGANDCNEGFIRDDALLVIVIITDEYDGMGDPELMFSAGDPQSWYQAAVDAKGGIPENVAALAIINYEGAPCMPAFPDMVFNGEQILAWVQLFGDNGFVGAICEPDYGPFFQQAIDVIQNACENFVPG